MSRIVQCPKCRVLLQEPPPGNPYYQCGSCSTTLQAKHHAAKVETPSKKRPSYAAGQSQHGQNQTQSQAQQGVDKQSSRSLTNSKSFDSSSSEVGDDYADSGEGSSHGGGLGGVSSYSSSSNYGHGTRTRASQQEQQRFRQSVENVKTTDAHEERGYQPMAASTVNRLDHRVSYEKEGGYPYESNRSDHVSRYHPATGTEYRTGSSNNRMKTDDESRSFRGHHPGKNFQQFEEMQRAHSNPVTATEQYRMKARVNGESTSARAPRTLKWQTRPDPAEKPLVSSPTAVDVSIDNRGIVDDDRVISPVVRDAGNQRPAVEQLTEVTERNWREMKSLRRLKDGEQRRNGDELPNLRRNPSEGSISSMGTSGLGADYEASESSSTVDECERIGGEEATCINPGSRPVPSRPIASGGMDANTLMTRTPTEDDDMNGPHHVGDKASDVTDSRRQLSWDETRMTGPSGSLGNNNKTYSPPPAAPPSDSESSRLRKSSSDDYVNLVNEQQRQPVVHHARMSSDPTTNGVHRHQQYHHQHTVHQLDQQNQWVARLKPQQQQSSTSAVKTSPSGVGSSVGNNLRPPTVPQHDRSPSGSNVHPDGSASPSAGPGGQQLPPKRVNYPPLPPPGALPHVNCQHCHTLLAVPVNLPPPKKSIQKLRCGACWKISIFSVPQFSAEQSSSGSGSEPQYGHSLFASSPDYHDSSSNTGYQTTSERSMSATSDELRRNGRMPSDLSDKSLTITRDNSLGSADIPSDEELAEKIRVSKLDHGHSYSNPTISTREDSFQHQVDASGFWSVSEGHSPGNVDSKSRFGPGPQRRGGPLEHGPSSGSSSSGRHIPDDRSRFAADQNSRPSSRRHEEGMTSSDSEGEHIARLSHGSPQLDSRGHSRYDYGSGRSEHNASMSSHGSPQLDTGGHGRSHSHGSGRSDHHNSPPIHEGGEGKDHNEPQHHRGFTTKLKGIMNFKSSLKELTHRGHKDHAGNHSRKVTVNGLPIPDNLVVKAEERAGPIMPGNYWYDDRAGFWGVVGDKCGGIIPPHIEEFEQPMSRDCAGGKTQVFVNGRELHERDLEILVKRGLPSLRGKSYAIDINGSVINEMTGEVIRELGRLAPSLDRNKRGAGMSQTHR
ncbi:hypothetical protein R1flu_018379 [Riccia fluitans]|uniref:Zinc-ribbon domain-containing protein n=1 Tax=Riccia fluitans TaxID=41844 RepID=A0ABD1ZFN7_9MARC